MSVTEVMDHHLHPSPSSILGQFRDAWSAMPTIVRLAVIGFAVMYAIGFPRSASAQEIKVVQFMSGERANELCGADINACAMLTAGYHDMFLGMSEGEAFCPPPKTKLKTVRLVFTNYLTANPQEHHLSGAHSFARAVTAAWPCSR